jgi:hypothetical protein
VAQFYEDLSVVVLQLFGDTSGSGVLAGKFLQHFFLVFPMKMPGYPVMQSDDSL